MTIPLPAGSLRATSLNAARRAAELDALAGGELVDLLVVGGGVTGAGVALDAASRGLSVALLEAEDLAFGTSRWSSKLVHGGLRYLAQGDVALAHESAVERGVLMTRTAPHLVRALPQLVPLLPELDRRSEAMIWAGLHAGDALRRVARTPGSVLPAPRRVPTAEALALAPGLRKARLRGGLLSFDGQLVDDARLVVALARTAAGFGARIITRARVVELTGDGAEAEDGRTGRRFAVRARAVVNATGVWADRLVPGVRLRPSRGSHLVVDARAAGVVGASVMAPVPGQANRFVFLLPQPDGRVYVGLTDEPVEGPVPDVPEAPESDVDFLLHAASAVLAHRLTRADVLGSFAGLRPLLHGGAGRTADLSRRHAVLTSRDGVVTVVGGKLTTYRRMAADAVDAAVAARSLPTGPSRTRDVPLVGAAPRSRLSTLDVPEHLVGRYGAESVRVAALAELDPALAEPVAPGMSVNAAEVVWAVRHEGALDVDDVLDRRTRLGLVPADRAAALPAVADLVDRTLAGVLA
ncbi:glycerol-3-phosphate dehydrogenase [Streptoalloteichus tenebrarius]|uniref:Glycerol-3-phosphate dehydrogenase n=1 Tax=Streptoalloteichus tenebrarius (strain ATCC 17920 / DSM 40477 / JCM 4838 / CBS 697.72 / NBRC 16177 / NCIMB 11028 / NRRL B-12390 / A12253. 1 / ISP 5477) TaxID=1933 RepID=A0ABT1I3S9_STRSD|nr:glycerol-3-phosphate dehydrogenase [Streptoalloteichus tenebrarius]BFF01330.1 FAD-dependent oxidoreductase [Streptoalloteichus tenebrarius]